MKKGKFIMRGIFFGLVAGVAITFGVMLLWNWLMPLLFGLAVITFWQALGILALSKILFGGGHGRPPFNWHSHERTKFREQNFKEKMMKAHHVFSDIKDVKNEKEE